MLFTLTYALSCLDHDGIRVDYWILFKHPGTVGFHIASPNGIRMSTTAVDSLTSPLTRTITPIYTQPISFALWNDEHPIPNDLRAHAKGILGFDDTSGFWITHSIPRFPSKREDGNTRLVDYTYAQSILCVSIDIHALDVIARIQLVNRPFVYDHFISVQLAKRVPILVAWLDEDWTPTDTRRVEIVSSASGTPFTVFAKSAKANIDLYEDFVATHYTTDLLVMSWRNGARANAMPSFCRNRPFAIMNIDRAFGWNHTHDHSKWAIGNNSIVCIGDINRQYSQRKRGGGTVCVEQKRIWKFLKGVVTRIEECKVY